MTRRRRNTVRNVTTCPYAGVCPQECVDAAGCANAVTDYLIGCQVVTVSAEIQNIFSGCRADCGLAQISDLIRWRDKRRSSGIPSVCRGGLAPTPGWPASPEDSGQEVIRIAEAIRRASINMETGRTSTVPVCGLYERRARARSTGCSMRIDRVVAAEVPTHEAVLPVVSNPDSRLDRPVLSRYKDIYYSASARREWSRSP